jgi:hypothetical protein
MKKYKLWHRAQFCISYGIEHMSYNFLWHTRNFLLKFINRLRRLKGPLTTLRANSKSSFVLLPLNLILGEKILKLKVQQILKKITKNSIAAPTYFCVECFKPPN